jgi:site-specific DNA-methyltransferase (adenine-specific)
VLRTHEYILVFSKGKYPRKRGGKENTIGRDEFRMDQERLSFPPYQPGKSATLPLSRWLPHRLIQLYTFEGDVVLDPFAGSGTTCLAALADGRFYIGYEIRPDYFELAYQRIAAWTAGRAAA